MGILFKLGFLLIFTKLFLLNQLNNYIMKNLIKFIDFVSNKLYGGKSVCDPSFKMF